MTVEWSQIKDVFYSLGSLAGIFALTRPVFESKHQLDKERLLKIYEIINEPAIGLLANHIWRERRIPAQYMDKLLQLDREIVGNNKSIRFSGLLKKWYRNEINIIYEEINFLLESIGEPYWSVNVINNEDTVKEYYYVFNKDEFQKDHKDKRAYKDYLSSIEKHVVRIQEAFRRLEVISELHFLESLISTIILPRRFREVKMLSET